MADNLCGPSNALQTFQKHTSVDRTLQQDRILNRQAPVHGFRSSHPSDGALDSEFAAFEANHAVNRLPEVDKFTNLPNAVPANQHPFPTLSVSGGNAWAAEFQRLKISDTSPSLKIHSNIQPVASQQPFTAGSWHREFLQHQEPQQPQPPQQSAYVPGFQPSFGVNSTALGSGLTHAWPRMGQWHSQLDSGPKVETDAQAAAFEAAFEQAAAWAKNQEEDEAKLAREKQEQEEKEREKEAEKAQEEDNLEASAMIEQQEQIRIGSDLIPPTSGPHDHDEFARTAGQLLEAVGDDANGIFKNSAFFALMRRVRDREVQLEGDEFKEVPQALHPGGQHYPQVSRSPERDDLQMSGARISPP